jgi:ABC-type antimicrobial peptide transport system permease subunit
MFTPVFVQGNSASAFHHPKSVVITEGMAERFFGKNVTVIGRSLTMENRDDYLITGVIKNAPVNTTLQFDWLVPFEDYLAGRPYLARWGANSVNTYAQLAPGADPGAINRQLYGFIQSKQNGANARAFLFAMKDWRLRDKFEGGIQTGGRIEYIKMFITIAWIVLLIACINFMNLSTARSEKRAREVGVRKVAGAERKWLVIHFIGEAMLMSFAAVLTGVLFIVMALPFFNLLVEKQLTADLSNPLHIAFALGTGIICGLVAGSYSALISPASNPYRY